MLHRRLVGGFVPGLLSIGLWGLAAWGAEPCYGHAAPNRLEGDHFWVEWADGAADAAMGQVVLDAAEGARATYTADMGWPFTEESVVIEIIDGDGAGISGYAFTVDCGEVPVPKIEITVGTWQAGNGAEVTAHEVGHAAEYGYMGDYLDAVASWLWFMEGTATWLESHATGNADAWGRSSSGYLGAPWVALHQGPTAFLVPERSNHMYGTAYLARYIEERHGADTVREMWAWAGSRSGTPLFLPDVLEGVGIAFPAFWERFLAASTVGDLEWGEHLTRRVAAVDVGALPAEGEPETGFFPEGTGITAVHFQASTGRAGKALDVTFDGDDEVEWLAVLVRTDGERVGAHVIDYVPLDVRGGEATGWLAGFDGGVHGWLLASPITRDTGPFRLSWEASLIDDPGPMEGVLPFDGSVDDEEAGGCACATPGAPGAAWVALVAVLVGRRRRVRG